MYHGPRRNGNLECYLSVSTDADRVIDFGQQSLEKAWAVQQLGQPHLLYILAV